MTEAFETKVHMARELTRRGNLLLGQGDDEGALECYLEALDLIQHAGRKIPAQGHAHEDLFFLDLMTRMAIGDAWLRTYTDTDDPDAVELARQAYASVDERFKGWMAQPAIREKVLSSYGFLYADNLGRLALALEYQGRLHEARAAYDTAIRTNDEYGATTFQSVGTLEAFGDLLRKQGELGPAQHYLERAQIAAASLPQNESLAEVSWNITLHLGHVYVDLGRFEEALQLFQQLLSRAADEDPGSRREAIAAGDVSRALAGLGATAEARKYLQLSLRINRDLNPTSEDVARNYHALGELDYLDAAITSGGDFEQFSEGSLLDNAAQEFAQAVTIRQTNPSAAQELAVSLYNLGAVLLIQGKSRRAKECFEQSLRLYREVSPTDTVAAGVLSSLGRSLYELGDRGEAIAALREAVTITESVRGRAGDTTSKERLFGGYQEAYQALGAYLFERNRGEDHSEAFVCAEQSKARVLVELLSKRSVSIPADSPEQGALLEEERTLKQSLRLLYRQRWDAASTLPDEEVPTRDVHANERDLLLRLERVERNIQIALPAYSALKYPAPFAPRDVADMLDDGTTLLEYAISSHGCFLWAITKDRWVMTKVGADVRTISSLIAGAVGHYQLDEPYDLERGVKERQMLSDALLGPVPGWAREGASRLVIVPDGPLHYLPFEMLPLHGVPLGDVYPISYVPSATALSTLRRTWSPPERYEYDFVGFGDPAFLEEYDGDVQGLAAEEFRSRGQQLRRLKGSGQEVRTIARLFGERALSFERERATEYRAQRHSEGARYVHFATHALIDDERAMESGIALAPPETHELGKDPYLDDMLQVHEMFALRLSAEVVVCSACQTGLGKLRAGEGMVGMTRALFFAGARAVVVSLWPVDDEATAGLMEALYRHLCSGLALDDAAAAARVEIRGRWPDPRYWAAFVVTGMA